MKKIWAYITTLCLLLVSNVVVSSSAQACSCIPMSPTSAIKDSYTQASAVVAGETIFITDADSSGNYAIIFRVEQKWKGDVPATTTIMTNKDSAACGIDIPKGQKYLFYINRDSNQPYYSVGACSRHMLLRDAGKDIEELNKISNRS